MITDSLGDSSTGTFEFSCLWFDVIRCKQVLQTGKCSVKHMLVVKKVAVIHHCEVR